MTQFNRLAEIPPTEQLQPIDLVTPGFRGLNTSQSGSILSPVYCTAADNAIIDSSGRLAARDGIIDVTTTPIPAPPEEPVEEIPEYWPIDSPSYLSAIPGMAGPGFDSSHGTGREEESTTVIFVNNLDDVNTGGAAPSGWGPVGRTFAGSEEWAIRHNASPKTVVWLTSGTRIARKSIPIQTGTPPRPGRVWLAGQTAPFPGLLRRGTKIAFNGASDVLAMHLRMAVGDDVEGVAASNRRGIESGATGVISDSILVGWAEVQWSIDESITFWQKHTNTSIFNSAVINPLHDSVIDHPEDPPDTDHGFAVMMGGGASHDDIGFFRNVIINATSRSPFVSAEHAVIANNLIVNPGRPYIGPGQGIILSGQGGVATHHTNVLWNMVLRGPDNDSSLVGGLVHLNIAGSEAYSEGNSTYGWTLANQAAFWSSEPVGFLVGSEITSAMPADFSYLEWTANPLAPTQSEVEDIIDIFEATVGAQPGWRNDTISRMPDMLEVMRDIAAGTPVSPQFVDTVTEDGGWPTVPAVIIDPLNPGTHWHSAFPVGSDRDDLVSGSETWGNEDWIPETFRGNALQLAGRTNLERWLIRQHWYVMSPLTHPDYVPPTPIPSDDVVPTIRTLHEYVRSNGDVIPIVAWDGGISTNMSNPASADISGSVNDSDGTWRFQNFNNLCIGFQDGQIPIVYNGTGNFAHLTASSGTAPTGEVGLAAFGRLWGVMSDNQTIKYSATLDHLDWGGAGAGQIDVSKIWTQGTDQITALAAFNGQLVVFGKKHIIFLGDGNLGILGISPTQLAVTDIVGGTGCLSQYSVQPIGESDLLFASPEGVQSLARVIQEKSNPITTLTKYVRDDITDGLRAEDARSVRSTYNPRIAAYLLSLPESNVTWVLDQRRRWTDEIDGEQLSTVTKWTIAPTAMCSRDNTDLLIAVTPGIVSQYAGDTDRGTKFRFVYQSPWLDLGEQAANFLKILKRLGAILFVSTETTVIFKWGVDFKNDFRSLSMTVAGDASAEYGEAEYNIDEFGGGLSLRILKAAARHKGQYYRLGIEADVEGEFALQQAELFAKIGRLG